MDSLDGGGKQFSVSEVMYPITTFWIYLLALGMELIESARRNKVCSESAGPLTVDEAIRECLKISFLLTNIEGLARFVRKTYLGQVC